MVITSASNPKLRYVRHLERRAFRAREGRTRLEGVRLVEEALAAGAEVAFALATDELDRTPRGAALRARLFDQGVPLLDIAPGLLAEVTDVATPQGILAVVATPVLSVPERPTLALVVDGVREPGNLGAILRSADAAGAEGAWLAPGTVDATAPKVVRAAMGAHFRLPIRRGGWDDITALVRSTGLGAWVADAGGVVAHTHVDWTAPSLLVVGGEAEGASEAALRLGRTVRIDMPGGAESLNAAAATAVLLFEAVRQRASAR